MILREVALLARNPNQPTRVENLHARMRTTGLMAAAVRKAREDEKTGRLIDSRYLGNPADLKSLGQCREGSLGFAYAKFLKENSLSPVFYSTIPIDDDESYLLMRVRQTHDVWHVVTGFDASVEGEIGLQAFSLTQIHWPSAGIIIGGAFFRSILERKESPVRILQAIANGFELGRRSGPLMGWKWEEHWHEPLDQIRQELGIAPR